MVLSVKLGVRLGEPVVQVLVQVVLAERAAFLCEQGAGFQPVEQLQQHLSVAFGQGRQQRLRSTRLVVQRGGADAAILKALQCILESLELNPGIGGGGHGGLLQMDVPVYVLVCAV